MSDDVDIANDMIQTEMAIRISQVQRKKVNMFSNTTGKCLWCAEKVSDGRRWCSAECAKQWEGVNK
jgi:predicted lipoprotein with Yx(FWY)xxD motif